MLGLKTPSKSLENFSGKVRWLSEQTIVENGFRRLRTKEDGGMELILLQNPSDPETTFRNKVGKEYRGYVANFEDSEVVQALRQKAWWKNNVKFDDTYVDIINSAKVDISVGRNAAERDRRLKKIEEIIDGTVTYDTKKDEFYLKKGQCRQELI